MPVDVVVRGVPFNSMTSSDDAYAVTKAGANAMGIPKAQTGSLFTDASSINNIFASTVARGTFQGRSCRRGNVDLSGVIGSAPKPETAFLCVFALLDIGVAARAQNLRVSPERAAAALRDSYRGRFPPRSWRFYFVLNVTSCRY